MTKHICFEDKSHMFCRKLFYTDFLYTFFYKFIPSAGQIEKYISKGKLKAESNCMR